MTPQFKMQATEFLKQSFFISLLFSVSTFVFIRLIFFSFPISFIEDSIIFLKTILTGWALVMLGRGAFEGLVFIMEYGQKAIITYIKSLAATRITFTKESFSQDLQYAGE